MLFQVVHWIFVSTLPLFAIATCPNYLNYSQIPHEPFSNGSLKLPYMRPSPACRTFNSSLVEDVISSMANRTQRLDLFQLMQNTYSNTLDTAVKWRGFAANDSTEELAFIITGDINAMWLRDSANQLATYLPLLTASNASDSLASLYRGTINLQARYIQTSPHCNSFQAPPESNIPPAINTASSPPDVVVPSYDNNTVFECKYELDSLAAFLYISANYFDATNDSYFFNKPSWNNTIRVILNTVKDLQIGTYADNGTINASPYTFQRTTSSGTETLSNSGRGNPTRGDIGLIRSAFRPSDDATIFQYLIPSNLMFAHQLARCADILASLPQQIVMSTEAWELVHEIIAGVEKYGIVEHKEYGRIYAYEVDGYGSINIMDDANLPSLLGLPIVAGVDVAEPVYQNSRNFVLSSGNPYFMRGPVISAIGSPHTGPGYAWPISTILTILTSRNQTEISDLIQVLLRSTTSLGLIHESVNVVNESDFSRPWFSWANGLFGSMVLKVGGA